MAHWPAPNVEGNGGALQSAVLGSSPRRPDVGHSPVPHNPRTDKILAEAESRAFELEHYFSKNPSRELFRLSCFKKLFALLGQNRPAILGIVGSWKRRARSYATELARRIMKGSHGAIVQTSLFLSSDECRREFNLTMERLHSDDRHARMRARHGPLIPKGVVIVCSNSLNSTAAERSFFDSLLSKGRIHNNAIDGLIVMVVIEVDHQDHVRHLNAMIRSNELGIPTAADLQATLRHFVMQKGTERTSHEHNTPDHDIVFTIAAHSLILTKAVRAILEKFDQKTSSENARRYASELRFLARDEATAVWGRLVKNGRERLPTFEQVADAVNDFLRLKTQKILQDVQVQGEGALRTAPKSESEPFAEQMLSLEEGKKMLSKAETSVMQAEFTASLGCGAEILVPRYGVAYCAASHCKRHSSLDKRMAKEVFLSVEERRERETKLQQLVASHAVEFGVKATQLEFPLFIRQNLPARSVYMTHPGACILYAVIMLSEGCANTADLRRACSSWLAFTIKFKNHAIPGVFRKPNGLRDFGLAVYIDAREFWDVTETVVRRLRGNPLLTAPRLPLHGRESTRQDKRDEPGSSVGEQAGAAKSRSTEPGTSRSRADYHLPVGQGTGEFNAEKQSKDTSHSIRDSAREDSHSPVFTARSTGAGPVREGGDGRSEAADRGNASRSLPRATSTGVEDGEGRYRRSEEHMVPSEPSSASRKRGIDECGWDDVEAEESRIIQRYLVQELRVLRRDFFELRREVQALKENQKRKYVDGSASMNPQ